MAAAWRINGDISALNAENVAAPAYQAYVSRRRQAETLEASLWRLFRNDESNIITPLIMASNCHVGIEIIARRGGRNDDILISRMLITSSLP